MNTDSLDVLVPSILCAEEQENRFYNFNTCGFFLPCIS